MGPALIKRLSIARGMSQQAARLFLSMTLTEEYAGEDGTCRIDVEELAMRLAVEVGQVQKLVQDLVAAGVLEPVPGRSEYRFIRQLWMRPSTDPAGDRSDVENDVTT